MKERKFWIQKILKQWEKVPIVWLSGVRRAGKTTIAKSFLDADYYNCDLPSVRNKLEDIEFFLSTLNNNLVIFDEIHQLKDPSLVLKIAADEYPNLKILATGSSTLAATTKFSDSLTGRKRNIHLTPILANELDLFDIDNIKDRIFLGGLPQALLNQERDDGFYSEWFDSYFARDIQELFNVEKRSNFLRLFEMLLRNNGQLTNLSNLAKYCSLSRPTIMNYLDILEITHTIIKLRPFHGGNRQEIIQQPKYYGFDTGFVCYYKGWDNPTDSDLGTLLENLTLDILSTIFSKRKLFFWRDKLQNEVDFIYQKNDKELITFECKKNAKSFNIKPLKKFRALYPEGENYVVTLTDQGYYRKNIDGINVIFTGITHLFSLIQ